jgi:hypothetical protein
MDSRVVRDEKRATDKTPWPCSWRCEVCQDEAKVLGKALATRRSQSPSRLIADPKRTQLRPILFGGRLAGGSSVADPKRTQPRQIGPLQLNGMIRQDEAKSQVVDAREKRSQSGEPARQATGRKIRRGVDQRDSPGRESLGRGLANTLFSTGNGITPLMGQTQRRLVAVVLEGSGRRGAIGGVSGKSNRSILRREVVKMRQEWEEIEDQSVWDSLG